MNKTGRIFTEEERKRGGHTRKQQSSFSRYGFNAKAARKRNNGLTQREKEVLQLANKTNKEIGDILSITEKSVTNHFTHILNKLGCSNRTEAALFAKNPPSRMSFSAEVVIPI
jgi:DNA-binding NarL/FixJ family response regulator